MDKRYQIFISSTYSDLIEERDKVTQAILECNCFPSGMEIFPAAGIPPKKLIEKVLKDCDYYLLIIAARYGSLTDDGISYTEWEYDIAVDSGIPVIAFLHSDMKSIPLGKTDESDVLREKLYKFRKKVEKGRQTVKYWNNPDDLKAKVLSSIPKAIEFQPRTGWVRADTITSGASEKEIDKLQTEIENHKKEVERLKTKVNGLEADLKKKDEDYLALESLSQTVQQGINNQNELSKGSHGNEQEKPLETKPQMLIEKYTVGSVSFKMVHIEGGTFMMGADGNDKDALPDETPAHEVTLSDYWIGETPVTQALWLAVMGKKPSRFLSDLYRPVECVSWEDCMTFIEKLNKFTGKTFCLPTEAQWEFAARGGKLGKDNHYRFAGSNDSHDVAWSKDNSMGRTQPVGGLASNELGIYDMSGNVWEWCLDWYDEGYYSSSPITNPNGPESGTKRVRRGGSWDRDDYNCRVSNRGSYFPTKSYANIGLRLVLECQILDNTN